MFLVMYWGGGENKMTYRQGGGHVFRQVLGGSDVFHWSFFSLKVIAYGGLRPPDPPYIPAQRLIITSNYKPLPSSIM